MVEPIYYGQRETDKYIEKYFPEEFVGNCIEVGVANGIKGSNTLLFEEAGWETLCIDPIPEHVAEAKLIRKRVLQCACSDYNGTGEFTAYNIGDRQIKSSLSGLCTDPRLIESHRHITNSTDTYTVIVRTLTRILEEQGWFRKIDFISVDTEGSELDVLQGIDFDTYDVKLLVVENNFEDPEITKHLKTKGFEKSERFFVNDFYVNRKHYDKCYWEQAD